MTDAPLKDHPDIDTATDKIEKSAVQKVAERTLVGRDQPSPPHAESLRSPESIERGGNNTRNARQANWNRATSDARGTSDRTLSSATRDAKEQYETRQKQALRHDPQRFKEEFKRANELARADKLRNSDASDETQALRHNMDSPTTAEEFRRATQRARADSDNGRDHVWADRGVVDTRLSRIDPAEYSKVWEQQRTHKYSPEDIEASLRSLPEVRRRLANGSTPDDLRALRHSNDPTERQLGRTYETYHGGDTITVEFSADGRSHVLSGRHRLASAQRMGMETVPIRVREQTKRNTEGE